MHQQSLSKGGGAWESSRTVKWAEPGEPNGVRCSSRSAAWGSAGPTHPSHMRQHQHQDHAASSLEDASAGAEHCRVWAGMGRPQDAPGTHDKWRDAELRDAAGAAEDAPTARGSCFQTPTRQRWTRSTALG